MFAVRTFTKSGEVSDVQQQTHKFEVPRGCVSTPNAVDIYG